MQTKVVQDLDKLSHAQLKQLIVTFSQHKTFNVERWISIVQPYTLKRKSPMITSTKSMFEYVPKEILQLILSLLSFSQRVLITRVCKAWKEAIMIDKATWSNIRSKIEGFLRPVSGPQP